MKYILITAAILILLTFLPKFFQLFKSRKKKPHILYKYIHPDAINYYLKDFTVSFTNYQYLNDPLETSIQNTLDYTKNEIAYPEWNPERLSFWHHYAMSKTEVTYADRHEIKRKQYESIKSYNADLKWKIKFLEKCRNEMGIFSLTTDKYNPVMWAHYANNHKGICIGFDMTHPFFNQSYSMNGFQENSKIFSLLKVDYKLNRPTYEDLSLEEYVVTAFSTKRVEWSYEKEYRLLRPITSDNKVRRVEKIPLSVFKEIYFGLQCETDKDVLNNIKALCKIYKIVQVKDSYELSSIELNHS